MIGNGDFDIIKTNFEKASINALRYLFPNASISGCSFHLGKSVYKRVLTTGLLILYDTNATVKPFVKSLTALAFVDPRYVESNYRELLSNRNLHIALR